jgi:hypothetical protein
MFIPPPTSIRPSFTHKPTVQFKYIGRRTLGRRLDTQEAKPDEVSRTSVSLVRGIIPPERDSTRGLLDIVIAA